jgi:CubicO group peptidase (beta-lactamase class C family)
MALTQLLQQWRGQTPYSVHGTCSPAFEPLKQALRQAMPAGKKGGVALAVYFRGELVADLWMGLQQGETLWQQDTLSMSYSTGKGILSTLVHILVDQGKLNYDRPIADYWPAFAAHGKEKITLRHIMSHASGLYDIRNIIPSATTMLDWDAMLHAFEQATPRFAPDSANAYQGLSYGWLIGGVVEKVMHEPLRDTITRELFEPLGIVDEAYFGVPASQLGRVARPYRQPPAPQPAPAASTATTSKPRKPPKLSPTQRLMQKLGHDPLDMRDALVPLKSAKFDWDGDVALLACMPSFNGVFSARALAKIYAMLAAGGEFEGHRYLSSTTLRALSTVQSRRMDRVMPIPMHWRLGYHRVISMGKRAPQGFGHIGYNGSGAWCDPARELSMAFVTSFSTDSIAGDPRLWWLTQRTLQLTDGILKGKQGWL